MPECRETMTFDRDEIYTILAKEIKELNGSDLISFDLDLVEKQIVCQVKDSKI